MPNSPDPRIGYPNLYEVAIDHAIVINLHQESIKTLRIEIDRLKNQLHLLETRVHPPLSEREANARSTQTPE